MQIELLNEQREFSVGELFFSTTDPKGRIRRANNVFERIAAYSWDELKNKPHNIIRHPDMPRIVFQILWDRIQAGQPVVAYVKNLAHDGRYYWVVALVVAMPGGYLSVRFKPTSPLLAIVRTLYGQLRTIEFSIESESNDRKAAIAASREALDQSLLGLGFNGYDEFMRHALKTEMQSREARLPPRVHRRIEEQDYSGTTAAKYDKLSEVLDILFADLEAYVRINDGVRTKSGSVIDISESLRVSALNGVIAVEKLGTNAAGLRPVLDWLRILSREITEEGVRLSAALDELAKELDHVVFGLSAAKLQIAMTAQFAHELADHTADNCEHMTEGAIENLHASSCQTVRAALAGLAVIMEKLKALTDSQDRLSGSSRSLQPVYLTGRIEMADRAGSTLATIFRDVGSQMKETVANLDGLRTVLDDLEAHLTRGIAHGAHVEHSIAQIVL